MCAGAGLTEVEAPAGQKEMLGFMATVYTPEQQARLGVNEIGEVRTQAEAEAAAADLSQMESMLVRTVHLVHTPAHLNTGTA